MHPTPDYSNHSLRTIFLPPNLDHEVSRLMKERGVGRTEVIIDLLGKGMTLCLNRKGSKLVSPKVLSNRKAKLRAGRTPTLCKVYRDKFKS